MNKKQKLFQAAKNNPQNVKFSDLEKLATFVGFFLDRTKGSHKMYKRSDNPSQVIPFQPDKHDTKMAKGYQVNQLVYFIEDNNLHCMLEV